jgi:acyl-CoA-binding protein
MSDIADKIYAATGLTLGAEEAAKIGQMIQVENEKLRAKQAARIAELEAAVTQCRTLSAMLKPQADRIAELEAALRQICDGPRDADKSYAELFAEVCWEARAALAGGKKDE